MVQSQVFGLLNWVLYISLTSNICPEIKKRRTQQVPKQTFKIAGLYESFVTTSKHLKQV